MWRSLERDFSRCGGFGWTDISPAFSDEKGLVSWGLSSHGTTSQVMCDLGGTLLFSFEPASISPGLSGRSVQVAV